MPSTLGNSEFKADIQTVQDTFKYGYDAYLESRREARVVNELFHNRHYTRDQLNKLHSRGQPKETFNVIKLFSRMLVGYYSTVNNAITVEPVQQKDVPLAFLMNDTINHELDVNKFDIEGDKIKLDGFLSGVMTAYREVRDTGREDRFGRPIRTIDISFVPSDEMIFDPMSTKEDYSDGRFNHRFKWVPEDQIKKLAKNKEQFRRLDEYRNTMEVENAEFEDKFYDRFNGKWKYYNNYMLVHTNIKTSDGKVWSILWSCDEILQMHDITNKAVSSHYRIQKLHQTNTAEYYGLFREVVESQHAINQALIKIQLSVNSQKIFAEERAITDMTKFTDAVNRVHGVIPVKKLSGVRVENMTREVLDQYEIIDKAFDRIQAVLGINDSFLGLAFASDSGRKVKLQQNATILALRYLTGAIEQFYTGLGEDMAALIKQYFTAEQAIRVSDDLTGFTWSLINSPVQIPTGEVNPETGEPEMEFVFEEVLDPLTNKPITDSEGNIVIAPIPEKGTEIKFTEMDIKVQSIAFNDEDERNQLMLENVMSGTIGAALQSANPAGFFNIAGMAMATLKTRYSQQMKQIMDETAQALGGVPIIPPNRDEFDIEQSDIKSVKDTGSKSGSQQLKLPQNTNEETSDARQ